MISLAQLHHHLGDDLRPAGGHQVARRQISGVHISELDDPTPYLEGGELLLTTGIPVARGTADKIQAYVHRLAERKVAALGLGLGAGLDEIPEALVTSCSRSSLELLVVPSGVPFMNVSRAYWDLIAKAGQTDLIASLGTQTALARAATLPNALASVVMALAQALGGWAVYLPVDSGEETLWPPTMRGVLPQLRLETARLNMAGLHSAATFQIHGTDVVEHPVLVGRKIAGFLALGAGRKLTKADRQVIQTVCVLLSLKAQQQAEALTTAAGLDSAVATLLLGGHLDAGKALAVDLGVPLPVGYVRLLVLKADADARSSADPASMLASLQGVHVMPWLETSVRDCRLRFLKDDLEYFLLDAGPGSTDSRQVGSLKVPQGAPSDTRRLSSGTAAALSQPMTLQRVAAEAGEMSAFVREVPPGTVATPSTAAVDPRAEAWVIALRNYARADLISTVRSYLRHRGQWEQAARELKLHRNSLRHRIAIAAKLIQADLDDPDVAAHLWLAVRKA
ncbi:PucR family transcriptional regulator [Arthrobacter sp. 18067]|uniref:PucR family transcriptional regulator n=1 Tax=Arthrobacter sp. 18067 TaxID=2681413 RepID=UPI00135AB675|nr:PucR family transcriptional regulator [Arthrobacter sp. 18067]